MADEKVLIEIEVDNDQAVKDINEQNKAINMLTKENQKLAEQGQKNSKRYQQNAAQIQKLNSARRQNVKLISAEKGSLNELRANLARLTTQRNSINASTTKGAAEFQRLTAEINRQNTAIKKAEQAGGDFRRNVGNYGDAIGQVNPAIGGMINQIKGLITASKAFIATPLGLILTGLAAAFGAVVSYFKRTEEGGDKLAVAMAYVTSIFESFMTALSNVGSFIVTYIINNFKLVVNNAKLMASVVKSAFLAIDVAIQKVTGSTEEYNAAQKALADNNKEVKKLAQENVEIIKDTYNAGKKAIEQTVEEIALTKKKAEQSAALQKLENRLVKIKREQITGNAELNKVIYEGLLVAKDENKTYAEREAALKKASEAEQKLVDDKLYAARIERDIAVQRTKQFDSTAEDYDKEAEAIAKVTQLEIESARTKTKIQATQLTLQKQKEADAKKEAARIQAIKDQEIELATKKEEARIKEIQDLEARNAAYDEFYQREYERQRLALETEYNGKEELQVKLAQLDFTYNEEKKQRQKDYEVAVIASNNAINENDKRLKQEQRQRVESNYNFATRLIQDGFTIAKAIASKNEKLQKGIAITQAIVNTALGVTKAFATLPYPAAVPAAIQVAATGAAQLATIAASGSGGSVSTPNATLPENNTQPNTTNADNQLLQQQALENAIANLGLTISVTEINNAQSNVALSESTASI